MDMIDPGYMLQPASDPWWVVFLVFSGFIGVTAFLSWLASLATRRLAIATGTVDQPTGGRKIHQKATPLLGGLGIGLVILFALTFLFLASSWLDGSRIAPLQIFGYMISLGILLAGGVLDDRLNLAPRWQFVFLVFAILAVVLTGTNIPYITNWQTGGPFPLDWWTWVLPGSSVALSFPGSVLTAIWLAGVTIAIKFFDGLDGLVAGQTIIGSGLIAALALSAAYHQPAVALLAIIIGASFLGFLPSNLHPAKQFLGESGSTIAGFSLGFLAILGGAKVATALMAIGLPIADASLVVLGRLSRGASPFRGDDTHLHFKLLKAGLTQRKTVLILWLIALVFGIAAFGVQSKGKALLFVVLVVVTGLLSYLATVMKKSRVSP